MYNDSWGGYPDEEFLSELDPKLGALRYRLEMPKRTAIDQAGGRADARMGQRTGLHGGHSGGGRRV